jgi:hypothetical protein
MLQAIFSIEIISVFLSAGKVSGKRNNFLKLSNPTNLDPKKPFPG